MNKEQEAMEGKLGRDTCRWRVPPEVRSESNVGETSFQTNKNSSVMSGK